MIQCPPGGTAGGKSTADCMPKVNNPIVLRTCTLEANNIELSVNIPCMSITSLHHAAIQDTISL